MFIVFDTILWQTSNDFINWIYHLTIKIQYALFFIATFLSSIFVFKIDQQQRKMHCYY